MPKWIIEQKKKSHAPKFLVLLFPTLPTLPNTSLVKSKEKQCAQDKQYTKYHTQLSYHSLEGHLRLRKTATVVCWFYGGEAHIQNQIKQEHNKKCRSKVDKVNSFLRLLIDKIGPIR